MRGSHLRRLLPVLFTVAALAGFAPVSARATLPSSLSDQEFWKLSSDVSEADGSFRSDNLVSNELQFPTIIPGLINQAGQGGVYMGVGPEQNFHYIVALKPKMAFITDIRRGNLELQLMYKALFELSSDRSDFVSRLFSKPKPKAGAIPANPTAADLMNYYWDARTSDESVYTANLQAIEDQLTKKHGFPLSKDDLDGIAYVVHNFYWFGPSITYGSTSGASNFRVCFADLMMSTSGTYGSFLASDDAFNYLKDFETRNLLVPAVGNFAGPKALRAVGQYVRDHGSTVTAFYLSNVEQYLNQDGIWGAFCANVATFPLDAHSTFIRGWNGMSLGSMVADTRSCGLAR